MAKVLGIDKESLSPPKWKDETDRNSQELWQADVMKELL